MSLFKKKVICVHCGGFFKRRKERNKYKMICSRVDNYGDCKRVVIEEDFLISTLEKRFGRELTDVEIVEVVEKIEIEDKLLFKIYLKDQEPIIYGRNHIVY
jgi:hypothetical protein